MNRLKAILAPAAPAGPRSRQIAVGLAAVIAGVTGAGSIAVAAQRQPVLAPTIADTAASRQPAMAVASPRPEPGVSAAPAERPAPVSAPAPAPRPVAAEAPAETDGLPQAPDVAQDAPPADITRVTWAQHPTPSYPARAAANGVTSGTVTLTCRVESDGRPSGCAILTEDPAGQGFGEVALASMEGARFSPATLAAASPGAKARFTIRFRMTE